MKDSAKYVIERIIFILLTLFIILSVTYILLQCLPPNINTSSFTEEYRYWENQVSLGFYYLVTDPGDIAAGHWEEWAEINGQRYYYAPYPILYRYWVWLCNVFGKWDWGTSTSVALNQDVISIIAMRLPASMKLNIVSIIVSIPLGLGLGIWAALKKNTWVDATISTVIMIFISVPSFVLISFLLIGFGNIDGWPMRWPSEANAAADPLLAVEAYVIPVLSLSFGSICSFARYTRAELCEVMSSEFLLLARTKGLTRGQSVVRHALRNSLVPIVPMIIGQFVSIISGSMVLEQIYGIPGIGTLFVNAINAQDYPVIMVDMAVYTTIGLFATLLVDLSYGIVDPRIRMGAKK